MASLYIPPEDDLMRCVPWARLRKDADNNAIGVEVAAFRLRPGEEYLSAGWVEFFEGSLRQERLAHCVQAFRKSKSPTSKLSGFAVGNTAEISAACEARGKRIRVIHEPTDDNDAHVAVRRWPPDDDLLFEEMARSVWNELILNKSIPD